MKLVQEQRGSIRELQEAVVHAPVEAAGVGEHQVPVMMHIDGVQFTVHTGGLQVSKGGVPVLNHTYTQEEEQIQWNSYRG